MQFRFILDIFLLINVFLLYKINNNILKYLYPIIFLAAITLVFAKDLKLNNSNSFMRMVSGYEVLNLLKPINYSVGYYESKISNIITNVVVTLDVSSDAKQPAINKRLLNIYSNNQLIPVLIDSTSIKKGFKSTPLKSIDIKDIENHLQNILSSNKN
ncbi:hypothetical protein [Faecalibacter bovis]|uniref:Uncharacterized protein n=1 Tax=Faecalibacter bovis TaxID=2898187 RepID=A0ABX7XBZ1_9FLAO|nr:hypothetical protein [Faecalibacter bovis]QTV05392.1 hypothetical protein J9309_11535 [Faecalibacter bovis]